MHYVEKRPEGASSTQPRATPCGSHHNTIFRPERAKALIKSLIGQNILIIKFNIIQP